MFVGLSSQTLEILEGHRKDAMALWRDRVTTLPFILFHQFGNRIVPCRPVFPGAVP